jgi:uncharacterized protein (UPF0332 family)
MPVAPNNSTNNIEMTNRMFRQIMDLCILPEITKRQSNGEIPTPFEIKKALVVICPDGSENQVRLNDEVNAILKVKPKEGLIKKKEEPIFDHEIEEIISSELTDADDPNCGHVLLINRGQSWILSFDFRYNKNLSKKHIERATEFIECAEFSFQKQYWGSFIDNLFSASELLAKSFLLVFPDPKLQKKSSHHIIKSGFNKFVNTGNLTTEYSDAINKLTNLRGKGRYLSGKITISAEEARQLLDCLKSMRDEAKRRGSI